MRVRERDLLAHSPNVYTKLGLDQANTEDLGLNLDSDMDGRDPGV